MPTVAGVQFLDIPTDPDGPLLPLTDAEVTELVAVYRWHWISSRDAHSCVCGDRWQCVRRRMARKLLVAAGRAEAIWTLPRTPR